LLPAATTEFALVPALPYSSRRLKSGGFVQSSLISSPFLAHNSTVHAVTECCRTPHATVRQASVPREALRVKADDISRSAPNTQTHTAARALDVVCQSSSSRHPRSRQPKYVDLSSASVNAGGTARSVIDVDVNGAAALSQWLP